PSSPRRGGRDRAEQSMRQERGTTATVLFRDARDAAARRRRMSAGRRPECPNPCETKHLTRIPDQRISATETENHAGLRAGPAARSVVRPIARGGVPSSPPAPPAPEDNRAFDERAPSAADVACRAPPPQAARGRGRGASQLRPRPVRSRRARGG